MSPHVPLRIERVEKGSPADRAGLRPDDGLSRINGRSVRDIIDVQFLASDDVLDFQVIRNGRSKAVRVRREEGESLGLEFPAMHFKACGNRCLFCFIDQNPAGMRKSIYFKDEDYRLSFLYGNYVTLTRVGEPELKRIVEQRLSPLYVSVHATDDDIRLTLLGLKKKDDVLEKIRYLCGKGIVLHAQIVLCLGYNDGDILTRSITDLSEFYPLLKSIAVVPVGLTRHRNGLSSLVPVDRVIAQKTIRQTAVFQKRFTEQFGEPFVYLADEFYLQAEKPFPGAGHYGDFWQIENGIGMTRSFLDKFRSQFTSLPRKLDRPGRFVIGTGKLAGPVIEKNVLPRLRTVRGLEAELMTVTSRFYGESVTVSGLITGRDVIHASTGLGEGVLVLPDNCVNTDGVFLDDMTPAALGKEIKREVRIIEDFRALWKMN